MAGKWLGSIPLATLALGFIVNMTVADGSATFNRFSDEPQFALPGLSDTRNVVLFYEGYGVALRAAYNWRDTYFTGGVTQPGYHGGVRAVGCERSVRSHRRLHVFVEGINVTDETWRTHGRDPLQLYGVGQIGARYNLGFRYSY